MSVSFVRHFRLAGAAALALLFPVTDSFASSYLAQCRLDVADGALSMMRARHRQDRKCLKEGRYCSSLPRTADDELSLALSGIDSACVAADVIDHVDLAEIAPIPCDASWSTCGNLLGNSSVLDSARCQLCMARGRDLKLKFDFEVADMNGNADEAELRCAAKIYGAIGRAAERGVREAMSCAARAGEPPWNCSTSPPVLPSLEKALARIDRTATSCEGAITGSAGLLASVCHRPVSSASALSSCARSMAICRACSVANATLGLFQDCASQSGDRLCDAELGNGYGRPAAGTILVANRGDDSVTFFDPGTEYLFGDLAASTFPTGDAPADLVIHDTVRLAYTADSLGGTVTFLDSSSGQPAFGSLLASSIVVGSQPSALALHSRGILYVANEGDGTVTLLDATNGKYLFGDLASSTFPTGDAPASLAVDEEDGILYVANSGDDSVTFLDAMTGQPLLGNLAASTFPAGDEPRSVIRPRYLDLLVVTNHGGGSVVQLDPLTGAPAYGTLPASTYAAGIGAIASAGSGTTNFTVAREGELVTAYSESGFSTIGGLVNLDSVDLGGTGSDLALSDYWGRLHVTIESEDLLATVPVHQYDVAVGYSAVQNARVNAAIRIGDAVVNPLTGEYYFATYLDDFAFAVVDPVTRSAEYRGTGPVAAVLAYNAATNVLYATDPFREAVLLYDATTGVLSGANGQVCQDIQSLTLEPVSGTLFARCADSIVYLDAATGGFRTGNIATSTLDLDGEGYDVVVDAADDRAYAERYHFSSSSVVALTISSVGYAGGTLAASHMLVASNGRGLELDAAADILYRGYRSGEVKLYDTSGTLLHTSALPVDALRSIRLSLNPASGLLYVSRSEANPPQVFMSIDDVVYLDANDGSFLHGTLESSSVRIQRSGGDVSKASISTPSGTLAVTARYGFEGPFLLDPDEPLPLGERSAYRDGKPTGDAPSALAIAGYPF